MRQVRRTVAALSTLVLTGVLGVVVPTAVAPPAAAYIACGYGTSASVNLPIPDNGSVISSIDKTGLTADDPLYDLDVTINIAHPFVGDLIVTLSYGNHTVLLTNRRGGGGDNYTNTRFNDGAASHISAGTAPFTGDFRPEQSLNAFDDLNPSGVWVLKVTDAVTHDTGTLQSWSMKFTTKWCNDLDRDYVKDEYDRCIDVRGVLPHGCPERARTLTTFYKSSVKEFRGYLKCSAAPRCAERQPVRIYKVAAGEDPLVGRTFSDTSGYYFLRKQGVSGQYYAVAPRVLEEDVAECLRIRSANIAV
ncbi:hypothetical protein D0Z08_25625 [Nocardioides immobilis]|uniref:P/Homo B domain-containing protein n=1 Tax=Nocardioides immobilis TaxID=2049295 RepID=A0A417XVA4_9ACTN|nr:proprotein convertase P-domain-containing protein [Nocardioides immobilis]RHW24293.1 hypothetical protein D0Z08_25625 [Nocardioides immobilis]